MKELSFEMRNEELEMKNENDQMRNDSQSSFVIDTVIDTDLALFFPDQYVPSDSERMLLYRELDNLHTDEQLAAYRSRLIDRFGPVPPEGEELMLVVPLRHIAGQLGCEKIMLKQGRMTLFFVSEPEHPFYRSAAFDSILQYVATNPRRCQFRDSSGKRSLLLSDIPTVASALSLLKSFLPV
jgi:transcription-repair coupling factor (superfamily II helicase)